MSLWHLVTREIRHRWGNFLLAFLSVAVAVACLVASLTALKAHGIETDRLLAEKKAELDAELANKDNEVRQTVADREKAVKLAGKQLEDSMRKITKNLGFNVWILPADQQLSELHDKGRLSKTMPESYVKTLAESKIVTINHLLPLIAHRIENWQGPLLKQTVRVVGTRGEVPFSHRTAKKPLKDGKKIPAGAIVLGHDIHYFQGLKKGDKVEILGGRFTVFKLHEMRGNSDDTTVFINLKEAQEALGKQNLINAMLALECNCASLDRIGDIRRDIAAILPGTQVIEKDADKALARAEARNKAEKQARESRERAQADGAKLLAQMKSSNANLLQHEKQSRESLGSQRESFAALLVPLVLVGCGLWIALLTLMNVRQRSGEIGILRAIGLRSSEILTIFLAKALLFGLLGAVVGYLAGFGLGIAWGDLPVSGDSGGRLFDVGTLLLAVLLAPALAALASWIPAMLAARQDPAVVLQAE